MAVAAADWKVFDMQIARVLVRVKAQSRPCYHCRTQNDANNRARINPIKHSSLLHTQSIHNLRPKRTFSLPHKVHMYYLIETLGQVSRSGSRRCDAPPQGALVTTKKYKRVEQQQ